jgi:hypothetical protein
MRTQTAALLWTALAVQLPAQQQQVPDPNFQTKVATPAYAENGPTVLFDEGHHNVHTMQSGYEAFAALMKSDGYRMEANAAAFTPAALKGSRILVIVNARGAGSDAPMPARTKPAFTDEECTVVRDWVRAGGSLLLVADHYPIGDATEELAQQFGVQMSKGVTRDPANSDPQLGGPAALVFSRENKLLEDHAITRGRNGAEYVKRVVSFTGQSLTGPKESFAFMKLADTAVDVSRPDGKQSSAAGKCQGLAMEFGKGRLVVLGEAAMLSAQLAGPRKRPMGMNAPGTDDRQLALNLMHWLSRVLN